MCFTDPAALDTNKDGDISADELEAGMQARCADLRARGLGGDARRSVAQYSQLNPAEANMLSRMGRRVKPV